MKILVVGSPAQFEECRQKLGEHDYRHIISHSDADNNISDTDVVFDFLTSEKPESLSFYFENHLTAFLNTWKVSLAALASKGRHNLSSTFFGFNGFPTLFNRECLEVSVIRKEDVPMLKKICDQLKTNHLVVEDRVGLVTPRVICMIINEAYYTVQEGTASREDIDLAMKLGTNYPYGPFEWCGKIGVQYVYELLEAVYEDTKDERYKVSALMKKEYLAQIRAANR